MRIVRKIGGFAALLLVAPLALLMILLGGSRSAKLFATWPKCSLRTLKIFLASLEWHAYARTDV